MSENYDRILCTPAWSDEFEALLHSDHTQHILAIIPEKLPPRHFPEGGSVTFHYLPACRTPIKLIRELERFTAPKATLLLPAWRDLEFARYVMAFCHLNTATKERLDAGIITPLGRFTTVLIATKKIWLQRHVCLWKCLRLLLPLLLPLFFILRCIFQYISYKNIHSSLHDTILFHRQIRSWQWTSAQAWGVLNQRWATIRSFISAYLHSGPPQSRPTNFNSILVIAPDLLGDTITVIPLMRALRRTYPEAQIHAVVAPKTAEMLKGCPYCDQFITLKEYHPFNHHSRPFPGHQHAVTKLISTLRQQKYDLLINASYWSERSRIVNEITANFSVSVGAPYHLMWRCEQVPQSSTNHLYENRLCILKYLLPNKEITENPEAELWPDAQECANALTRIDGKDHHPLIGISYFAALSSRRYPMRFFREVMEILTKQFDAKFLIFDRRNWFWEDLPPNQNMTFVGDWPLRDVISVMPHLDLFVANEGGLGHMAYALHVPCCLLFTSISPINWSPGPKALCLYHPIQCSPCAQGYCHRNLECHDDEFNIDEVRRWAQQQLASRRKQLAKDHP